MSAQVQFKRGSDSIIDNVEITDGNLLFTSDEQNHIHKIYMDEKDNRVLFSAFGGRLTIGGKTFDGSADVNIDTYNGDYEQIN